MTTHSPQIPAKIWGPAFFEQPNPTPTSGTQQFSCLFCEDSTPPQRILMIAGTIYCYEHGKQLWERTQTQN